MILDQCLVSRNFQQQSSERQNLELFKNLLQPHFLFNPLNNLYALSLRQSDQTPDAIAGLSQLLEKVVTYSRKDLISLREELALIEDYIALEKFWLGECSFLLDLQVKGDVPIRTGLGIEAVRKLLDGSFRKSYYLDARPIGNIYNVDIIISRAAA